MFFFSQVFFLMNLGWLVVKLVHMLPSVNQYARDIMSCGLRVSGHMSAAVQCFAIKSLDAEPSTHANIVFFTLCGGSTCM